MKAFCTMIAMLWAGQAAAHPGHLAEAAGHGHWLGAAALGAAIAIGLWQGLKGKKARDEAAEAEDGLTDEDLPDAALQEA